MDTFEELRQAYLSKSLTKESNIVSADDLKEFPEEKIVILDKLSQDDKEKGLALLKERKFARLILNGGMATRFGGKVKGICEVYEGKTFLDLKVDHMKHLEDQWGIPEIPIALMCSSATYDLSMKYLEEKNFLGRKELKCFLQEDFPRLTVEGEEFESTTARTRSPRGHGDFIWALDKNIFDIWEEKNISHFDFSNIDNLGATIEPSLIGAFAESQKNMGIELVKKNPGDVGGAACLRQGVAGVLEGIYFPEDFDQDRLIFFSPNNLMFRCQELRALLKSPGFTLPWNVVTKNVDDGQVIQFEKIAIDTVFAFNQKPEDDNVFFIEVPREGKQGRFYPIKSPQDLEDYREILKERLKS